MQALRTEMQTEMQALRTEMQTLRDAIGNGDATFTRVQGHEASLFCFTA